MNENGHKRSTVNFAGTKDEGEGTERINKVER